MDDHLVKANRAASVDILNAHTKKFYIGKLGRLKGTNKKGHKKLDGVEIKG